jgi:transposase-like protein
MKHRQFTDTFKREAVRRATTPGIVKASVAKELDITSNILHRWIREAGEAGSGDTGVSAQTPQRQVRGTPQARQPGSYTTPQAPGQPQSIRATAQPNQVRASATASSSMRGAELQAELDRVTQEATVLKKALAFYFSQNV